MPYPIINTDYLFLLKKICCLKSYNLKTRLAIFFTKLKDFNKNIKCNLIIYTYYNLLLKNLRQKNEIEICYI